MDRRLLLTGLAALTALAACKKTPAPVKDDPTQAAFLVANATKPGVVSRPSGLQYKILTSGPATGVHPAPQDEVKFHYEGKLLSGKVFDSSYERGAPSIYPVEQLVPGWVEALQLMRPGDTWELYLPAKLGYGDKGAGDDIPPGATLIFKLELLDVLAHAAPRALV